MSKPYPQTGRNNHLISSFMTEIKNENLENTCERGSVPNEGVC